MYLRVFIRIFELQMYTLRHTPYQFFCGYWMLWIRVESFSSRMDVCDISNFLTLTLCALVGFWHGIDALDWGIAPSLRLWSRLWVVIQGHTPFLSIFLVGLFMSCLSAFSNLTLAYPLRSLLFWVLRHRVRIRSLLFRVLRHRAWIDPSCFWFSSIAPIFDPFCFGFSGISSGFYPFCFGFSGIVPGFNPIVLGSLVLAWIWSLISRSLWCSPGYDSFSSTRPNFYLIFGTRPNPTLFRYSPGSYTFSVLAQIWSLFWYSPGFYLFNTHPDLTHFLVLARIHSLVLRILRYSPRYDPSFWLLRYLPGPFSGTFLDSLSYSLWHWVWTSFVISSSVSRSPLLFRHRARVPYLLRHRIRFSPIFSGTMSNFLLSSLASCPDSFSFL